nr:PREDICTED: uncharacterized protein LOC108199109 isoform X2 [Daucus carota subsp. sativus]
MLMTVNQISWSVIRVTLDRQNKRFQGMHDLFVDFSLKRGEILFFETLNRSTLNVFIVGEHLGEIQYPNVVHSSQDCSPTPFICTRDDWHFVYLIRFEEYLVDELVPPHSFMTRIIQKMPAKVKYVLDNGDEFCGTIIGGRGF